MYLKVPEIPFIMCPARPVWLRSICYNDITLTPHRDVAILKGRISTRSCPDLPTCPLSFPSEAKVLYLAFVLRIDQVRRFTRNV